MGDTTMTEDQIERRVESMVNRLDEQFMSSDMCQSEYDDEMRKIDQWATQQYRMIAPKR